MSANWWTRTMWVILLLIVLLRAGVALQQIRGQVAIGTSLTVSLAFGVLGLVFLACGAVAYLSVPSMASGLFFAFCAGQAVHWGGPYKFAGGSLELATWFGYFVVTMVGVSALLHFTLVFPNEWKHAYHRGVLAMVYAPPAVAAALGIGRLAVGEVAVGETLHGALSLLETLQVNLYPLIAVVIVVARFISSREDDRQRTILKWVAAGIVLGNAPFVAVSLAKLPPTTPFTLFFALTPLMISYALLQWRRYSAMPAGTVRT